MALELIGYLKDSRLVASIQQFFGVRIHYDKRSHEIALNKAQNNQKKECIRLEGEKNHVAISKTNSEEHKQFNGCVKQTECPGQEDVSENKHERGVTISENSCYTITNFFWYYLFSFGTELGDEIFYSTFIPFLFWNIDAALGRRVVLVWATVMSTGQMLKDIICWPRPACPPAVRLQNKWAQEYGMPSTHAMVGLSIPFSILFFTMSKYIYPFSVGCVIASLWCVLVSMSRIYLGMHTVLDVLAGLILAIAIMIPLVPLVDVTNTHIITNFWIVSILIAVSIAAIVFYPNPEKWTPTRSDTAMVVSVTAGIHAGAWLNYVDALNVTPLCSPPYHINWPDYIMLGHLFLRTLLGFSGVLITKALCKYLIYTRLCAILGINWKDLMKCQDFSRNRHKVLVDLVYKYVACFMIGVHTVYLFPMLFHNIGINRPAFFAEM